MHDHVHDGQEGKDGTARFAAVIAVNALITAAEYVGGIVSGSLALISDAGHNLADTVALILGYAGQKLSRRDPTDRYTFGFKRFEVLTAFVNALSLLAIGVFIIYEAIERFTGPRAIGVGVMLPVAALGLAGNLVSVLILHRSRKDNLNIRAAFLHILYDAISSVAVIVAAVVIHLTGETRIDLAVSGVIAVMIIWSSFNIIAESGRIFLQGAPAHLPTADIYGQISRIGGVAGVHGLHVWSINSTEVFLSCHICLVDDGRAVDTDSLIRGVNDMLEREFGIRHTTIQIENRPLCQTEKGECCR